MFRTLDQALKFNDVKLLEKMKYDQKVDPGKYNNDNRAEITGN